MASTGGGLKTETKQTDGDPIGPFRTQELAVMDVQGIPVATG